MKAIASLSLLKSELSSSLFNRLQDICSDGFVGGVFFIELPLGDPVMTEVRTELSRAGFAAWNATGERQKGREYALSVHCQYSQEELASCSLLEIAPSGPGWVDGDPPRVNNLNTVPYEAPALDIGLVGGGCCYVASAKVYKALLSGGFSDLIWRLVQVKPSGVAPDERRTGDQKTLNPPKRGPWRELRSEIVLPRLAPDMPLFHTDHSPFTGDFSKGCWRRDGLYRHPELRYRASDLAAIEPFDLAHTYEMFGDLPQEHKRPLVASQRFYQYCLKHGIETSWQPVRIEA